MSRKCCPASPCFADRQNAAGDQSFDFLFHNQYFSPPTSLSIKRRQLTNQPTSQLPNWASSRSPKPRVRVSVPAAHPLKSSNCYLGPPGQVCHPPVAHVSLVKKAMLVMHFTQQVCELHPLFSSHIINTWATRGDVLPVYLLVGCLSFHPYPWLLL